MIKLQIHICDQRRSYLATFEGDRAEETALTFLSCRSSTHAFNEVEGSPIDDRYVALLAYLYPECEHGLTLSLCAGPQHYPYDDDEMAAYGYR